MAPMEPAGIKVDQPNHKVWVDVQRNSWPGGRLFPGSFVEGWKLLGGDNPEGAADAPWFGGGGTGQSIGAVGGLGRRD